jgi:tRNA pseudouridine13 synthase
MMASEAESERPSKRLKTGDRAPQKSEEAFTPLLDAISEKESAVGITTFINKTATVVSGLVKKRYTDFLVNEVAPGGHVLHLTKTRANATFGRENGTAKDSDLVHGGKASQKVTSDEYELQENVANLEQDVNVPGADQEMEISADDKARLMGHLSEKAVSEILELHQSISKNPKKKSREHPVIRTDFTSDRTVRAHIHQDIRRIFNSKIDSSTTHEGVLVLTAAPPKNNQRQAKAKPYKSSWQERGGEYCHFTLYKENKDTMEAISLLARFLKMNSKDIGFAGTKDRRAATVQRVSARRVDAERLAALNKTLRMMVIGDFEYSPASIGLGDLQGNEFTITLRDCDIDTLNPQASISEKVETMRSTLSQAMSSLHTQGFLNYFGLQRFGTFTIRSDIVGLRLLSSDFEGACNAILDYSSAALMPLNEEDGSSQVGREDRARAEAIKVFRDTGRVNDSLDTMPKRFSAEANIIRHLGKSPQDFLGAILSIQHGMRTMYVHAYQSMVWNAAASERWRLYGDQVKAGDLVLIREHRDKEVNGAVQETVDADGEVIVQALGDDRAKIAEEMFERARALTGVEAESGLYLIDDIVLPQPGYDIMYPQNASGEFYKTFMGSQEGGQLDPNNMRRKQKDFSLPGAYRKMLARVGPNSTVDVHTYHNDEDQFVLTDWEKLKGDAGSLADKSSTDNTMTGNKGVGEAEKIAAVLEFQLGTSQYATIALRELSGGRIREYKPEFSGGR